MITIEEKNQIINYNLIHCIRLRRKCSHQLYTLVIFFEFDYLNQQSFVNSCTKKNIIVESVERNRSYVGEYTSILSIPLEKSNFSPFHLDEL